MDFVYPALFRANEDGSYTITFPDLPGCISGGQTMGNAIHMAQSALTQWIGLLQDKKMAIPASSAHEDIVPGPSEFINLIHAEIKDSRAQF
jgi:predicted RNase H-like HicB family nuclease